MIIDYFYSYEKLEQNTVITLVYTRTWSRNCSHIHLLRKKNHKLIYNIVDKRAVNILYKDTGNG